VAGCAILASSALDLPFHPDLELLPQCRRELLFQDDPQRIRRGVFHSIASLQATINAYLVEHNGSPKPVVSFIYVKP
jgi:hypothetical protein